MVDIREAVRDAAAEGVIPCARALALAEQLQVSPSEIGAAADAEGIRVVDCQLGCFGKHKRGKTPRSP